MKTFMNEQRTPRREWETGENETGTGGESKQDATVTVIDAGIKDFPPNPFCDCITYSR